MFLILNVESGGFLKWERINQNNLNFWYINSLETLFKWLNFQIGTLYIRLRNIYWQDWRYTSFTVFFGYSQNILRHNAMCRHELVADVVENIGLKHLHLHRLYRFYHQINSIYNCGIIESNVLNQSVSY